MSLHSRLCCLDLLDPLVDLLLGLDEGLKQQPVKLADEVHVPIGAEHHLRDLAVTMGTGIELTLHEHGRPQ